MAAFDRVVMSGGFGVALVCGYSGAGKSAVAAEFLARLGRSQVHVAAGKFDRLDRGVPFGALGEALGAFVARLLTYDSEGWGSRLAAALGANMGLLAALVPELGRLPHETVVQTTGADAENRMLFAIERLIAAISGEGAPLVLFLDDLQWIDPATARLIEHLADRGSPGRVLLLGAYRTNEAPGGRPCAAVLESLFRSGRVIADIALPPLSEADLRRFTADALGAEPLRVQGLAAQLAAPTAGNPLFTVQLLTSLAERGQVAFDAQAGEWRWPGDLGEVGDDDLAGLMMAHFHRLSPGARGDAARFSCPGAAASRATLSLALGCAPEAVDGRMAEAVAAGLVFRRADGFAFMHDQVQEAAFRLVPGSARAALHLEIARALHRGGLATAEAVFACTGQHNRALDLLADREERLAVARLNLAVAAKATAAAGYAAALEHLDRARETLAFCEGEDAARLRFEADLAHAEALTLVGDRLGAERELAALAAEARAPAARARIAWLRVTVATAVGDVARAVDLCLDHLREVGADWSPHPSAADVAAEFEPIRREIVEDRIEARLTLPTLAEGSAATQVDVLTALLPPAFFTDRNLVCLVLCRMANLSAAEGNGAASALGYAYLGMVLGPMFGDYAAGYRFGRVGMELSSRPGLDRFAGRTLMTFAYHVLPYSRPLAVGREPLRRAFDLARAAGDLTYAGFSACTLVSNLLAAGEPLASVERPSPARWTCSRRWIATCRSSGLNWLFDHAETISDRSIDRIAALGGGIAVQHRMAYQGEYFVERYGAKAAEATPPVRKMLDRGVRVSAGTDATRVASYNPWVSLAWLVTGRTVGGLALTPERNRLDRMQALRMWTENVAWFCGDEGRQGRIAPGMIADLIVPDRDYFAVPTREIADLTSDLTMVGGRVVFAKGEFAALDEGGPPPAMPDWSPVNAWGGYAGWKAPGAAQAVARAAAASCGCGAACAVHGHDHAHALGGGVPARDLKAFWGALGCACWAV